LNSNGVPDVDLTSPRISRPFLSHRSCHVKIADSTTTRNLSGT
jgi:hypothetical protein